MKITVTTRKTLTTKYGYTNQQITTSRKKNAFLFNLMFLYQLVIEFESADINIITNIYLIKIHYRCADYNFFFFFFVEH